MLGAVRYPGERRGAAKGCRRGAGYPYRHGARQACPQEKSAQGQRSKGSAPTPQSPTKSSKRPFMVSWLQENHPEKRRPLRRRKLNQPRCGKTHRQCEIDWLKAEIHETFGDRQAGPKALCTDYLCAVLTGAKPPPGADRAHYGPVLDLLQVGVSSPRALRPRGAGYWAPLARLATQLHAGAPCTSRLELGAFCWDCCMYAGRRVRLFVASSSRLQTGHCCR